MSYTLQQIETWIDFYLGAENIYSNKTLAANAAREYILLNYDVREFIKTATLTFASGVASKPADYLRAVKMIKTDDSTYQYFAVDEDQFDESLSRHFTLKDSSGTEKFFIQPTSITSTILRYVHLPDDMTDASETGFNNYWRQAHAAYSAWWLLKTDRQPIADSVLMQAQELAQSALVTEKRELNATDEISTIYDKQAMFNE